MSILIDENELIYICRQFNLTREQGMNILYLRSRNRWSIQLENQLIRQIRSGTEIDILNFGSTEESSELFLDKLMKRLDDRMLKIHPSQNNTEDGEKK